MERTGSVASLAIHIDAGVTRIESIFFRRVIFLQISGVALGAGAVPTLKGTGPVEWVRVIDGVVGVEMEPALTPFCPGPRVPGRAQRLESSIRKLHQILLEGLDPEGVGNLILR